MVAGFSFCSTLLITETMKVTKLFNVLLCLLSLNTALAQSGIVRGTVIEEATGEPLFGVTVQIKGTTNGAITDFDGKFEIKASPGTYDIQASFVSFQTITISGLIVQAGEVTVIDQISLKEDVELLEEVVVTAEVLRTTEAALLTVKRKSANLIDGISAASFRKIGDSDAAGAIKRVTGVSIEGGKYVYVRGLGDRYTKTMLNGVDIPGLDPDKNALQIDIFPTNLIDNIVVTKTAVAELPADFAGGIVNIETKDFPEEKVFSVSLSTSFNPSMHFNSDYLSYEGSSTDWLGFDTDTRELPSDLRGIEFPNPIDGDADEILGISERFSNTLGATPETSFVDYGLGLSYGDQKTLKNGDKVGYIFSGSYKRNWVHYDDRFFGDFQISTSSDDFELVPANIQTGVESMNSVFLGGQLGVAYKTDLSKYRLTAMILQNGESKAGQFRIDDDPEARAVGKSEYVALSDNLEYSERTLRNLLINGEHHLKNDEWIIDWRVSPTISRLEDPDIRKTAFTFFQGDRLTFNSGAGGVPTRIWRFLDEINVGSKVDVTKKSNLFGREAKFKFGLSNLFKERDYAIFNYDVRFRDATQQPEWTGDANAVLVDENLFPTSPTGAFYRSFTETPNPNEYNSTVINNAVYVSAEFNPIEKLKTIVGLRIEDYSQKHTGRSQVAATFIQSLTDSENGPGLSLEDATQQAIESDNPQVRVLQDDVVLDETDFFPSLNMIYALKEKQNLRFSYSRTIARPSFKELSFAQIIDPVSNRRFNGALFPLGDWDGNLTATNIDNFDLRWETFQDRGQTISVSVFYKTFERPIELVRVRVVTASSEFQPRNVGNGTVYGAEIEFRKALDFISPRLTNFSVNGNVTLVESQIDMFESEFQSRVNSARAGETVDRQRDMAGQAPYIINLGLQYNNIEKGLEAGFFYNVKGETLNVVGGGIFPDVYTEPFHSLNFNLNKSFGKNERSSLNFKVENILNDRREMFYQNFNATDQEFDGFSPGTTFAVGLNYNILN